MRPTYSSRIAIIYLLSVGCLLTIAIVGLSYAPRPIALYLILPALLLLAFAAAKLLIGYATRPIEEIAAAAESIVAGRLKSRLAEPAYGDNTARLVAVFNQMLDRLDAALEAQRRFTALAAHELRTPLTILKGEVQVALGRRRKADEYENILRSNLEEIEKLVVMIDDLLQLARYEGGETDSRLEPVRIDSVITNVAADLETLASINEIDLRLEAERPLSVYGDRRALERLVHNLVENALRYTNRGGTVTVRATVEEQRISLIVEDTGVGIAPEDIPQLYDRFFRSSSARSMNPGGTGLGLPFTAAIARLHDASIDVTSILGKGTRFVVKFPLRAPSPSP